MKIKKKSNAVRVPPLKKPIRIKRKSSEIEEDSIIHKAVKNAKKVIETKNKRPTQNAVQKSIDKPINIKLKKRFKKRPKPNRGLVYLGHIPHGFYEEQMQDYFKQFGRVTKVRLARSQNTGRSRGYGYIQFLHTEVAKVAAETMNNYLMCGRLLKASYIPPEKQHDRFFSGKSWSKQMYPKLKNRNRINGQRNSKVSLKKHKGFLQSTRDKLSLLEKKLKDKGIDLKFQSLVTPKN